MIEGEAVAKGGGRAPFRRDHDVVTGLVPKVVTEGRLLILLAPRTYTHK